ncbi:hypothetical protein GAY33_05320 [Azospirillum brasilense]|uniref:hypothetical protein n=1 Tax=Azospirillum argentinense TaxID=2970906 RepID=UPI00190C3E8E|nr:hypothetical protein [Azospirillum argentinense]MBK3798656.1 hypothetical protein [Azospirillum argentinense]
MTRIPPSGGWTRSEANDASDLVVELYRDAVAAEAEVRRTAFAIAALNGPGQARERQRQLGIEMAAMDRFARLYSRIAETPATSMQGILAKLLLYTQCTSDLADRVDQVLLAGAVSDVERLGVLPLTGFLASLARPENSTDAFRRTVAAFEAEAALPLTPTPGMVVAGMQAGGGSAEDVRRVFAAMMGAHNPTGDHL